MGLGPGFFGLLNIPPCASKPLPYNVYKYGNTYTGKIFCCYTGGGGMIF